MFAWLVLFLYYLQYIQLTKTSLRVPLLQCPAELVGTGGGLAATAYAVEARDDIVDVLSAHQLADALKVATASAEEEDLLDDVVLVGRHVYEL